jgi:hypothetical protein
VPGPALSLPLPIPLSPFPAAHAFALGEHTRALTLYRALADAHPEQPAYRTLAKVLAARIPNP